MQWKGEMYYIMFLMYHTIVFLGCGEIKETGHQDGSFCECHLWIVLDAQPIHLSVQLLHSITDLWQCYYIVSIVLVSCNSTVNPFIYVFVNQKFRRKVKSLICCSTLCSNRVDVSMDSTTHTIDRTNTTNQPTLEEENCS